MFLARKKKSDTRFELAERFNLKMITGYRKKKYLIFAQNQLIFCRGYSKLKTTILKSPKLKTRILRASLGISIVATDEIKGIIGNQLCSD